MSIEDGIAVITLDRPDKLNAFTTTMENELIEAFDATDANDAVRAVILTGAGRAFCAGADLSSGAETFSEWSAESNGNDANGDDLRRDGGGRVVLRMFDSLKPIIAAINGPAVGVGITMTLAADFRLAADDARMGFVFNRRGLVPSRVRRGCCRNWFAPASPRLDLLRTDLHCRGSIFGRVGLPTAFARRSSRGGDGARSQPDS